MPFQWFPALAKLVWNLFYQRFGRLGSANFDECVECLAAVYLVLPAGFRGWAIELKAAIGYPLQPGLDL